MASVALEAKCGAWQSRTVRQFQRALLLTGATLVVGVGLCGVEKGFVGDGGRRFLESPSDVVMRALGLAHFLVGWLFLLTSPRLWRPAALGRLVGWAALGALACVGLAAAGGLKHPALLLLFYGYFLVHDVRDQAHLYQTYGDCPADADGRRFLDRLSAAVAVLLAAVLVGVFSCHGGAVEKARDLVALPHLWLPALTAALALGGGALLASAVRLGGGAAEVWRRHQPLLLVYAGIACVLLVGLALGSVGFNLIILLHVTCWLVFVRDQLRRRAGREPLTIWAWWRRSPAGFVALHLGVAAVVLGLMGLRVHVWERAGWVSDLLARSGFAYWSVMHITVAFWRGR